MSFDMEPLVEVREQLAMIYCDLTVRLVRRVGIERTIEWVRSRDLMFDLTVALVMDE